MRWPPLAAHASRLLLFLLLLRCYLLAALRTTCLELLHLQRQTAATRLPAPPRLMPEAVPPGRLGPRLPLSYAEEGCPFHRQWPGALLLAAAPPAAGNVLHLEAFSHAAWKAAASALCRRRRH